MDRFPGKDMHDLFITTAQCIDYPELAEQYPQSGCLFKVRIDDVKGQERYRFG